MPTPISRLAASRVTKATRRLELTGGKRPEGEAFDDTGVPSTVVAAAEGTYHPHCVLWTPGDLNK